MYITIYVTIYLFLKFT